MLHVSIQTRIERAVMRKSEKEVFSILDFLSVGSYEAVKKTLQRLEMKGMIGRVMNGLYYRKGRRNAHPAPDDVALAIANKFNWTISPSGERCLYILGLSGKDPGDHVFRSSGPYRSYRINGETISFRHTTQRDIVGLSTKTAVVVGALKTIDRSNLTLRDAETIRNFLSAEDRSKMISECYRCTSWVYDEVLRICL